MDTNEYKAQLDGFTADLITLEAKLASLEIERTELQNQIERTKRICRDLGALCGLPPYEDVSVFGFTDACRAVINGVRPEGLTAVQVREELTKRGYDLAPYTNPLSSIYTILRRLEKSGEVEPYTKENNLSTFHRAKPVAQLPRRFPRLRSAKMRAFVGKTSYGASHSIASTPNEQLDPEGSPRKKE